MTAFARSGWLESTFSGHRVSRAEVFRVVDPPAYRDGLGG